MRRLTFGRDDVIFKEGEFALSMYEIVSGSVGIYANYGTSSSRMLAALREGEFFGEMGLAECYPRSATAVALEDGTALDEIDADEFSSYFRDKPDTVLAILRTLSARLRETNARYLEARQAVHDAIEAERAGAKKERSLVGKLTSMLRAARSAGAGQPGRS
ncbi:MAG: Crp/Fnr family transcriptional regulator [Atopobiaceae bacterium]|nr:Crp/Fnr family transcriptional regulator [Atopobiaceae bacterium]